MSTRPTAAPVSAFSDKTLRLSDGRTLAYAEWGAPGGTPVVYAHGTRHSRFYCPDPDVTCGEDVRLLIPDRPGVGGSSPQHGHRLASWPRDIRELVDALGIDRFGVVGWSGGGGYAAACAALLPERLTGVAIVSSGSLCYYAGALDDDDRRARELALQDPERAVELLTEEEREWAETLAERPQSMHDGYVVPEGDVWHFEDPDRREMYFSAAREAVRQGAVGVVSDWVAKLLPWGFRLEEIDVEVSAWHGAQDGLVDFELYQSVVSRIPRSRLIVWPDAGHAGVAKHWREVLRSVT